LGKANKTQDLDTKTRQKSERAKTSTSQVQFPYFHMPPEDFKTFINFTISSQCTPQPLSLINQEKERKTM